MSKYLNHLNAGFKVMYDKTTDYLSYYTGIGENNSDVQSTDLDDKIEDYDDLIKVELYENENHSKRICQPSGKYKEYTTLLSGPSHIIDNIYLGSAFNAASYSNLKELNIKMIINATLEISNYYPDEFIYIRCGLYDNNRNSIKKYLEKSYNDIIYHQQNTTGNILIHCFMGASRSASIVLYYLMKKKLNEEGKPYSFDDSLKFLKEKRSIVNPTFRLTKDLASSISSGKI